MVDSNTKKASQYYLFELICDHDNLEQAEEKVDNWEDLSHQSFQKAFELKNIIKSQDSISALLTNENHITIFPRVLSFYNNKIIIIGEDHSDHCLVFFPLELIKEITQWKNSEYIPNYSMLEVNRFVDSLRNLNEKSIRLIMKVKDKSFFDCIQNINHLILNPIIITNFEGEKIWAGTFEKNQWLFEWINSVDHMVVILDPVNLEELGDFEAQSRMPKEMKKAS